jgi:hypothetical protein
MEVPQIIQVITSWLYIETYGDLGIPHFRNHQYVIIGNSKSPPRHAEKYLYIEYMITLIFCHTP